MRLKNYQLLIPALLVAPLFAQEGPIDAERAANTIILDEVGVKNLNIETEMVEERSFETTVFSIGRLEELPENRAVLSSRISGRVVELNVYVGDTVEKGDVIARVESRQPGNPPPVIDLKAPMSGLIVDSHIRLGEPVEPAQDMIDISDRSRMWAVAKIPENESDKIVPGTKARIHIPSLGEELFEATMVKYGVEANRDAGTLDGIFVLENKDGRMKPGMRAEFAIVTSFREDVMAVPGTSVQGDPTKRVVFVKDFELPNAYVKVPLVLGERNDRYFEVINGLFPGDEVVTKGSYSLSFAGSGSGISLKEALDMAHGHEHNEDGSEMTPAQKAAEKAVKEGANSGGGGVTLIDWMIRAWAVLATVLLLITFQSSLRNRNRTANS